MIQSVAFYRPRCNGFSYGSTFTSSSFDTVYVWNRSFRTRQSNMRLNMAPKPLTLEQAVQADVIFSCLPTSADVERTSGKSVQLKIRFSLGRLHQWCTGFCPKSGKAT